MRTNDNRYDTDFYAWTRAQATLLDARQWDGLDIAHLVEEILSLGNSEAYQLASRLEILLTHLLKLALAAQLQPTTYARTKRGWQATVRTQRIRLEKLLRKNPSLRPTVPSEVDDAYETARIDATAALEVDEGIAADVCPWTAEQVLDSDFWP